MNFRQLPPEFPQQWGIAIGTLVQGGDDATPGGTRNFPNNQKGSADDTGVFTEPERFGNLNTRLPYRLQKREFLGFGPAAGQRSLRCCPQDTVFPMGSALSSVFQHNAPVFLNGAPAEADAGDYPDVVPAKLFGKETGKAPGRIPFTLPGSVLQTLFF
jgi:hypothetical protein